MKFSIRRRLLMVAALGLVTCVLSIIAISRPITSANRQRLARAERGVERELERLQGHDVRPMRRPLSEIRSGRLAPGASFDALDPPLGDQIPQALEEAVAESKQTGSRVTFDRAVPGGLLFAGVAPIEDGGYVWAAFVHPNNRWTPVMRILGVLLGILSFALVIVVLHAIVTFNRSARSLQSSLAALGQDLDAPITRPNVRELGDVADGIAQLARALSLSQAALAERERLAVLGRVTAGLAHELRNPLASIKLQIDLVSRQPDVSRDVVAKLADVLEEIGRLDRLINDLLSVAARRTGPREDTDMADLARRRVALLESFSGDQKVVVEVTGGARTRIDRDAVARVIDNVVRNAIEASPRGGRVEVTASADAEHTRLRITDQGAGIPVDRQAELFEPFFTTKPGGVGLGLALSRAIATAHGGALLYRREAGRTVFELSLPAKEETA